MPIAVGMCIEGDHAKPRARERKYNACGIRCGIAMRATIPNVENSMTKRTLFDWVLRRWFPKRYIRKMMKRAEDDHRDRLRAAQSLPVLERQNLRAELHHELSEWIEWL